MMREEFFCQPFFFQIVGCVNTSYRACVFEWIKLCPPTLFYPLFLPPAMSKKLYLITLNVSEVDHVMVLGIGTRGFMYQIESEFSYRFYIGQNWVNIKSQKIKLSLSLSLYKWTFFYWHTKHHFGDPFSHFVKILILELQFYNLSQQRKTRQRLLQALPDNVEHTPENWSTD